MIQKEEKVDLDTQEIIKKYKREVVNLHRALSKIQKDKERLLVENLRLKELLNETDKMLINKIL